MPDPMTKNHHLGLPGHHAPAVGFEVPLEMLAACHGRVQSQCETLNRLVVHLRSHGADLQAQRASSGNVVSLSTSPLSVSRPQWP